MENETYKAIECYLEGTWVISIEQLILKTSKFSRSPDFMDKLNHRACNYYTNLFRPMTQQECFLHGKEIGVYLSNKRRQNLAKNGK